MRSLVVLLLFATPAALALTPDNLLLLTNKNVPESRKLADFYAAQRKLPEGRIVELDLPTGDEITFADYENKVVAPIRDFLAANNLRQQVTCLVTIYGVPLKITARVNTPEDTAEAASLRTELKGVVDQIAAAVSGTEAVAREIDPTFTPRLDPSLQGMLTRDAAARNVLARYVATLKDPKQVDALVTRTEKLIAPLVGAAAIARQRLQALDAAAAAAQLTESQKKEAEALRGQLKELGSRLETLHAHRGDPKSRALARALIREQFGLFEYARLLDGMIGYFSTANTGAAVDSELALLHWNYYTRTNSIPNPMRYNAARRDLPPILMTSRLDAGDADTVQKLIAASVKTEADGLTGQAVVDAGGNLSIDAKNPSYAAFDRLLQDLARILQAKTKLALVFDQKPEVLPAHSVKDPVAIYCGWYALQHYTPACTFSPGAVGYHVASFELTTLHNPSFQWCRGLLNDGVVATLGAVTEPYLNAFPAPDEFFPLLLTGKLTLAEVYWKTNPFVSWQIALIGDPLYTPYRRNPAMTADDLPANLQAALNAR